MRSARPYLVLPLLALLFVAFSPNLKADEWDKKTTITFSGPVDVAGHRLEAGTYVFKLADMTDRNIVQVFNPAETHVYATILAMPDYRLTPTDNTVVKFSEKSGNTADAEGTLPESGIPIKEWFYPGDNFGQEFKVKPAPLIAEALPTALPANTEAPPLSPPPAPAEKTEAKAEAPAEEPAAITPAPAAEPETAAATAAQSEAAPAQTAAAQTPAKEPASDLPAKTPTELPQTASPLPLIGLIGLISLGVGVSLREIMKRTV
jgi:hypothetical protein